MRCEKLEIVDIQWGTLADIFYIFSPYMYKLYLCKKCAELYIMFEGNHIDNR